MKIYLSRARGIAQKKVQRMVRPFFDTSNLRVIIFYGAFAIWIIPEFIGSFSQRLKGGATGKDRGSYLVVIGTLYAGMFLAFFLAFRLPAADIRWHPAVFFGLGIAILLAGVALRLYAMRALGRFFTRQVAIHTGQTVIQSGPYHLIRHPSYTGSLITLLGMGLALTNWASLVAALVIPAIGFLYRIPVEERALVESLGDPYREYMHRTHRLIPFIW